LETVVEGGMFWRKARPSVDLDTADWILDCWEWLDGILGPIDVEPKRSLILPSRKLFPDTPLQGQQKAEYYFDLVRDLAGLSDWPVDLRAQAPAPNIPGSIVFGRLPSESRAIGTFQRSGNAAVITYDPAILSDRIQFVATMAHELAHYVLLSAQEPPPGGPELEELATDLATVHLGFGLFGANAAFQFKQVTDFDRQGWSSSQSGYLGENGWCFACALFAEVLEIEPDFYRDYVKASVVAGIRKNRIYLTSKSEILRNLKTDIV
jgi:hypothetical protein